MRRTIAATAVAALALTVAPSSPARAQGEELNANVTVDVTAPAGDVHLADTQHVRVEVRHDFTLPREIETYRVELHDAEGPLASFCQETYGEENPSEPFSNDQAFVVEFDWDTNRLPSSASAACDGGNPSLGGGDLLPNGPFEIYAYAKLRSPVGNNEANEDAHAIKVSNAVTTPTGVELKRSGDDITVSWAKNGEVDLAGYRVQECIVDRSSKPCEAWDDIAEAGASHTSVTVQHAGPGIYRYRVAAVRPDADGAALVSGYVGPKSDPTEILVEEPPPPTTTTTAPDDEGGESAEPAPPQEPRPVVLPRRVQRSAPRVVQNIVEEDRGFDDELPYDETGSDESAIAGIPIDGNGEDGDQRALMIPLAGGALFLALAGQLWYLNRRSGAMLEPVPLDD